MHACELPLCVCGLRRTEEGEERKGEEGWSKEAKKTHNLRVTNASPHSGLCDGLVEDEGRVNLGVREAVAREICGKS